VIAAAGFLRGVLHDALVLFAMVNVVGNLPLFSDLTAGMEAKERGRTFRTGVAVAGGIVIGFAFLGDWMLRGVFDVSTDAFKIAGGILVFTVAAKGMLQGVRSSNLLTSEPAENPGVFPIGFPFLAGPGTIVTTILLMQTGGSIKTALAAALVYLGVLPVLYLSPLIERAAGRVSAGVVTRILYIFIAAKAVTFILTGLKPLLG
jgi:multiple antibiotic resistance protein